MRKRYRNGDPITLSCGCNNCNPARIDGVLCHEQGCPSAWKDHAKTCIECKASFYSPHRYRETCHRHQ